VQESPVSPTPNAVRDGILLRPLSSIDDYDNAVALQDDIWGAGFSDRVPAAILRVAQKVGGVSAGAFDANGRMIGFVFGLTGIRDGQLVHWSDMLAVREEARGHHLGERLKHFQRDLVRALGVTKMLWTFDPLVSRNAHFNLNRLGARIADYVPDFYGSNTGSILHGALPTDRFVAVWAIDPPGATPSPSSVGNGIRRQDSGDVPVTTVVERDRARTVDPLPDTHRVRVPIPFDIEALLGVSEEAALTWRLATRTAMMHYLARGYRVTAFHRGTDRELPSYELSTSSSNHA
jgi:chorismate synthase